MANKMTISLSIVLVLLAGGAWWVSEAGDEILAALSVVLQAAVITSIVVCLVGTSYLVWNLLHRAIADQAATRMLVAQARRAERDAQHTVVTAGPGEQVYIAEENHAILWRAAHRDPRVYANGQWTEPAKTELGAYLAYLASLTHQAAPQLNLLEAGVMPDLLTSIRDFERMLIVGSSGAGKTTLLQHVCHTRPGEVIVCDVHDDGHTWPPNCQVVGGGQNYADVMKALQWIIETIRARYALRATGAILDDENCPLTTLVLDEWRELVSAEPDAADVMKKTLTSGRKIRMGVVLGSHSERVGPLGIRGEGDLKDGFYVIRLHGDKYAGFSATLDQGDGEIPVKLPGPYQPHLLAAPGKPASRDAGLALDLSKVERPMDETERAILAAWDAGNRSITKLGILTYGSKGGAQNNIVREVLRKHGRV